MGATNPLGAYQINPGHGAESAPFSIFGNKGYQKRKKTFFTRAICAINHANSGRGEKHTVQKGKNSLKSV